MRHVPSLVMRELGAYFLSPMAYIILLAFQAIACINFMALVDQLAMRQGSVSVLTNPMNLYISGSTPFWIGLLVAVPALTMRLLAEEKRSGTIETLLTVPITETEIVVSKWLSGVVMYLVLLVPFAIYLPVLYVQGHYAFETGPLVALAIGLASIGMMFVAIGLFFSSVTKNQILAAIGTFAALFMLVVLTTIAYREAALRQSSLVEGLRFVSLLDQMQKFGAGQLDLRFLAIHLSATVFMLFLTAKVIESRQGF
ncbi:MAG TPA: ABC transporter permease subunit [Isosphaeraceae bacterium]|jgi:ABC-2 type transport system permease protein|nr:ABC transporter permease subunit [Isosphaeraceae bacterium]